MKETALLQDAIDHIREKSNLQPKIGIILGTGVGELSEQVKHSICIPYTEIPHFPTPKVHTGNLILGYLMDKPVVVMQGRVHYYEGYSLREVTFPIRVMKCLGIQILIISNASGGLNPSFKPGDIMIIVDHINLLPDNPLRGMMDGEPATSFVNMYNAYDRELVELAERTGVEVGISLVKGVYVALQGPSLETPAEYRMLRLLGADAVGMSTVPEVIVARQSGIRVLGLSIITNMGYPQVEEEASSDTIIAVAKHAAPKLLRLIEKVVEKLDV